LDERVPGTIADAGLEKSGWPPDSGAMRGTPKSTKLG